MAGGRVLALGPAQAAPAQPPLSRVATILDDADLELVATNDVFWDEIASVQSLGEQPVYDATTGGCRDGLHADRANENQGAEATLSFLLALVEMRGADDARIRRGATSVG